MKTVLEEFINGQVIKVKFPGSFVMHQKLQWEKIQLCPVLLRFY